LLFAHFFLLGQNSAKENVVSLIENAYQKKEFVGLSAGVIDENGTIWNKNIGYRDQKNELDFNEHTISRIASVTKIFTAAAIMQLIEKDKLSLGTLVGGYLPEFSSGLKSTITVKHLLEHSSGISHYQGKKEINNTNSYESLADVLQVYAKRDLLFVPGTKFEYSVYGYVTLGLLIEKVSGLTYEEYLTENLFTPANMEHTSIERIGDFVQNKSKLYHKHSKRKTIEITDHDLSNRTPAGGIQTTLKDLLFFGRALINNTLISKESLELMMTSSRLVKEPDNPYGFGLRIYGKDDDRGRIVGHNGQQLGCSAFLFLFPDKGVVTAVISNTSVFRNAGAIGVELFRVSEEF